MKDFETRLQYQSTFLDTADRLGEDVGAYFTGDLWTDLSMSGMVVSALGRNARSRSVHRRSHMDKQLEQGRIYADKQLERRRM